MQIQIVMEEVLSAKGMSAKGMLHCPRTKGWEWGQGPPVGCLRIWCCARDLSAATG